MILLDESFLNHGITSTLVRKNRFLEKYKISTFYLQDPLVKMRLGGATNKSLKNIYNQNLECIKAFRENGLPVNNLLYPILRIIPKFIQLKK